MSEALGSIDQEKDRREMARGIQVLCVDEMRSGLEKKNVMAGEGRDAVGLLLKLKRSGGGGSSSSSSSDCSGCGCSPLCC